MRTVIISLCSLCCLSISAQQEHHDWEDNHVLQINREPARAYFIPYGEKAGDRMLSLNGDWKFRWTKTPEERIKDFFRTDYDTRMENACCSCQLGSQRLRHPHLYLCRLSFQD